MVVSYLSILSLRIPLDEFDNYLYPLLTSLVGGTATLFLTYPLWPSDRFKPYVMLLLWPLGLGTTLFFVQSLAFILSDFSPFAATLFFFNIALVSIALPPALTLLLLTISLLGSLYLTKPYTVPTGTIVEVLVHVVKHLEASSYLTAILAPLAGLSFRSYRGRLLASKQRLEKMYKATRAELAEALHHQERFAEALDNESFRAFELAHALVADLDQKIAQAHSVAALQAIQQTLKRITERLQYGAHHLEQVVYAVNYHLHLTVREIRLAALLNHLNTEAAYLHPSPQLVINVSSQQQCMQCDIDKVKVALSQALQALQAPEEEGQLIFVWVQDSELTYDISLVDGYQKCIPAIAFTLTTAVPTPQTASSFAGNLKLPPLTLPLLNDGINRSHISRIIDAHYGYYTATQQQHTLVFPVRLRDIRPEIMELDTSNVRHKLRQQPAQPLPSLQKAALLEQQLLQVVPTEATVLKSKLQQAIFFIKKYHRHQRRKSGAPFYTHPLAVALLVHEKMQDADMLLAALLHDTAEDTRATLPQIGQLFGNEVQSLVGQMTKLSATGKQGRLSDEERHRKLFSLQDGLDTRVLIIKLADRLHNMRTLIYHASIAKQQKIAAETQAFYVPLAHKLGFYDWEEELQKIADVVLASAIPCSPQAPVGQ